MRIWHVGASRSPNDVNGVNYAIWSIAKAQATLDHAVSLILDGEPDEAAGRAAKTGGFDLPAIPNSMFRYGTAKIEKLLETEPPQIVHFHSVFIPKQAQLAKRLERAGIPFVITTHGGLSPHILRRGAVKKRIYSRLIEKPRLMRAAAISAVMPKEIEEIRRFIPEYRQMIRFVPNPIDDEMFDDPPPKNQGGRRRIVYLGRFDVEHKGIDILLEIARFLPQADFHLYGAGDAKAGRELEFLKKKSTCNVHFHEPVFGAKKIAVLQSADLYLQTSRWEAFGISVAEAMALGTPCAVAETMFISELFRREKMGVVLEKDPKKAANRILNHLRDEEARKEFSARAKKYAAGNFSAARVAAKFIDVYRGAICAERTADWQRRIFEKNAGKVGASLFEAERTEGERKIR